MDFLNLKALHIIFVITWFSGLFYSVRLFIYHTEAEEKPELAKKILQVQYQLMSKRLWLIITWPSAILTGIFGLWMLFQNPSYLELPWMHVKLSFVIVLYLYHFSCHYIYRQLQNDTVTYTANQLRIWNEIATILLFSIVFIVVLKSAVNWIYGVLGIVLFSIILMVAIKLYKRLRNTKNWERDH